MAKKNFQKYGWLALTFFTFFFLLGNRPLNEPDEGRYAEIAREMIQTGNWLVPHLWYLPHLDKPPMTYWLVAISMKLFGQNEWAVRLPVALAGIGGVIATFLLGCSLGGRRVGIWSALILQSSLLYFTMSRFLTTDIFLTAFNVWAIYFFWQSWLAAKTENGKRKTEIILWQLFGWIFVTLGFLTKGPIAFAIPAVSFLALLIFRPNGVQKRPLFIGIICGFTLFLILAAPWFLVVFQRVPDSAHYMILGQAAGHLLGTTIKNRTGSFFYFFGILAVGLLPWTILLGWLWKMPNAALRTAKEKFEIQNSKLDISKDGWWLLNVWAIFTFALFTFSHAKLPAYILPIFPALAVMLAWKFFEDEAAAKTIPFAAKSLVVSCALLLPLIFPLLLRYIFHDELPQTMYWQIVVAFLIAAFIPWLAGKWQWQNAAMLAVAFSLLGFFTVVAEIPQFETTLKANQTFEPIGAALEKNVRPGDAIVCWGKFPEGLPFYASEVITPTNRPYLGGMDLTQVPFEFPGNRERLENLHLLLPDENALAQLVKSDRKIWLVDFGKTIEKFQQKNSDAPLRLVDQTGQWQLYSNH
jgi:4-amino-4-deoxy-L-arabinose transferase-like glycosyltransferase